MSGIDHSLMLRRSILSYLKSDPAISSIVSDRVFPEQPPATPAWPFIRYGFPDTQPFEAQCWSGSEQDIIIHAFAKGPGTDAIGTLAKAISDRLNSEDDLLSGHLLLEGDFVGGFLLFEGDVSGSLLLESNSLAFGLASIDWLGTQVVRDTDEAAAFHAVIRFNCKTYETVSV